MTAWTFADVFERVADALPDEPCQIYGDRVVTWAEFDCRANALAADLLEAGLGEQSKVVAYLYNGPEYLEAYHGAFKAGMVPVNANYRYGPDEIGYLLDNADAEAVVFDTAFTAVVEEVRPRLPNVRRWYAVGGSTPEWAVDYGAVVGAGADRVSGPWGRSPDHLLLLYTGGTTGLPKGVMWRQDDLFNVLGAGANPFAGEAPRTDLDDLGAQFKGPGPRLLPACPLMHGTGQFSSLIVMGLGGCIVTLPQRSLDPVALWDAVADHRVNILTIVGDAFARPLLAALEAKAGQWDLSSLVLINSSGVMWSHEVKEGLLRHLPGVVLFDSLGSSEAVGMAGSVSATGRAVDTAQFSIGERVKVFTEDGREVTPGSSEAGIVAIGGYIPVGYYGDEEKTAKTFRTINGVRYSLPGDWATVAADGTLHLLGRGSVVINTGGEKVFPEEVEEVLKELPVIEDAVCVGLPDDRFGETVCAVVQLVAGGAVEEREVIDHVRQRLARYKAPRRVVVVDSIGRSPAGKVDYRALRELALERTATTTT